MAALQSCDYTGIAANRGNMLEEPARVICPKIGQIRNILEDMGGIVFFSGSGSCFFVVNSGEIDEAKYLDELEKKGIRASIVETKDTGIEIID